jgi:hypothetical protein
MKSIPNNIVAELTRYLPILLTNIDEKKARGSLRLTNAIRKVRLILPRLERLNNTKDET